MDLSNIVSSTLLLAKLDQTRLTPPTTSTTATADLLAPVTKRLNQQIESTKVQLSAYGQIKSAFSTAQGAAAGLNTAAQSKTATNVDIEKAAQAFVSAYNQAATTVNSAINPTAGQSGALASDLRAKFAGNGLARAASGAASAADLKQAGISRNTDGTLSFDAKVLQQSLQANPSEAKATLAKIGQAVDTATSRELGGSGNVGGSVTNLSKREEVLSSQQAQLAAQSSALDSVLSQRDSLLNSYSTNSYIAAYKSLFG